MGMEAKMRSNCLYRVMSRIGVRPLLFARLGVIEASKGQQMNVSMATNNGANYFNILAPGENEAAMFVGWRCQTN
jgi:hypothetical protein